MVAETKSSDSFFPLAGLAQDGWSNEKEATSTCLCGTVQLAFPTSGPSILTRFICHCADCHKLSSSMFCSAFAVDGTAVRFIRGKENLKSFSHHQTIATGNTMSNHFCSTCGVLMYRVSSSLPEALLLRLGPVDDFRLAETMLRPDVEIFTETRVEWLGPVEGVKQFERGARAEDV
ncbi:Mss4-like protein [Cadophora sp. MPI-SDFR-AT-0126]|nr:Mss4-like protein [Leotiomycetes sp. MPI-SDFR-AT-0126]